MAPTLYNLARFDLVSIRLVLACARSGSLTAAAREANLALAAASRRIKELEFAVAEPLFERHARGVSATPAGRVFVRHGLAMLQAMDQLSCELADVRQGIARHIRLWASTAAISQYLPPLLAGYEQLHPKLRIDLEEQVSDSVVVALREGQADIGIFVEGGDTNGLESQLFRTDELILALPRGHVLAAGKGPIAFADALEDDWISLTSGAALLQQQQQAALAANKPFRVRMQVRSFDAVCHLVASGLGVALLPKVATLATLRNLKLGWRPVSDVWARRRLLVAVRRGPTDPAIASLVSYLAGGSQESKAVPHRKQ